MSAAFNPRVLVVLLAGIEACGAGKIGGGDRTAIERVDLSGHVYSGLCTAQAGMRIDVLDDAVEAAISDDLGSFSLDGVPASATLRVTGINYVTTLSAERVFVDGQTGIEVAAVPSGFSAIVHSLAGFSLRSDAGTVLLGVVGAGSLPLADVEVVLLDDDGSPVGANSNRRYAAENGFLFDFFADGGTRETGLVAFFDVEPGHYVAVANRAEVTLPPVGLRVVAGAVTLDIVHSELSGGVPSELHGEIRGLSTASEVDDPFYYGVRPVADATVTAFAEGFPPVVGNTDASGAYTLAVPWARQLSDITVTANGYQTLRTRLFCTGGSAGWSMNLTDTLSQANDLSLVLGDEPLRAGTGAIAAWAYTPKGAALVGATLRIDPPERAPFYGLDRSQPPNCAHELCDAGGTCSSGSRCQDGECVLGETGPLCDSCAGGITCPEGYGPVQAAPLQAPSGALSCYCMPIPTTCDPSALACPADTFCAKRLSLFGVGESYSVSAISYGCYPRMPLRTDAGVLSNNDPTEVSFPNLPPGVYTVRGEGPGGPLVPEQVRVSEGVETWVLLFQP